MERDLATNRTYSSALEGVDLDELARVARATVEARPSTGKQIGAALAEKWRGRDPAALAYAARNLLPLVQVPPRAVWGRSGQTTYATLESWLGRPLERGPSLENLVLRYLGAFGPASVADVQVWSGLTRLREVVDRLRPQLRTLADENGRELLDLPDAPRPDPETPAPPRFLPDYDNLLRSHADRTRVIADDHRRALATRNGVVPGTVLLDGTVSATWWMSRSKRSATLHVQPFHRLSGADTRQLLEEAEGLMALASADAETRDVRLEHVR